MPYAAVTGQVGVGELDHAFGGVVEPDGVLGAAGELRALLVGA